MKKVMTIHFTNGNVLQVENKHDVDAVEIALNEDINFAYLAGSSMYINLNNVTSILVDESIDFVDGDEEV